MNPTGVVLSIGLSFSLLASAIAYVVTYEEYAHHFAEKVAIRRQAFGAALTTFAFFALFSVVLSLLLPIFI
jgi:hypothetical protein